MKFLKRAIELEDLIIHRLLLLALIFSLKTIAKNMIILLKASKYYLHRILPQLPSNAEACIIL